jgi:hypothetical protein
MRVSKKNLIAEKIAEKQEGEDMPYEIEERDDEYCVVKTDDGEVAGCHETEAEAEAQLAALNINVVAHDKRYDKKQIKLEPLELKMEVTNLVSERLKRFLAMIAYNSSIGHSANFGMFVDGDGADYIKINDLDLSDYKNELKDFQARYNSIEMAGEDGYYDLPLQSRNKELITETQEGESAHQNQSTFFDRLKLAAKNIIDLVTLAETEKETEVKLFMNKAGISQKMVNGELWHFTYSTNAFEDREGEIFSTKSLEQYVKAAKEKADRGFFNLWHIPGTDFARKGWQEVIGRFLVEAGPYLDDERGRAAAEFFKEYGGGHPELAPEGWGCSPEFRYLPEERAKGVYENIWITRTSTLPKMAAANIWTETRQLARKEMSYSEDQIKTAVEVFKDEDFVKSLFAEGETKTAELEAANVAHKEKDEAETEQPVPQEIQLNMEELAAEVGKQFQADLTPIGDAIVTMANDLKELRERLEKLEETKQIKDKTETPRFIFNLKRASEADETTVTDDDGLKNKKPIEAEANANDPWAQTFNK